MANEDDVPRSVVRKVTINKGSDDLASIAIYKALRGDCGNGSRYCIRFLHDDQKIAGNNCTIKEMAGIVLYHLKGDGKIDITVEDPDICQPYEFIFSWG